MKLNAVNSITTKKTQQNKQNTTKNNFKNNKVNNKNVSFKGIADFATVFWNFVDKGGRGLQFTVEDMFGTNIPRTYSGAMSGYEYTHEINWQYLYQEGIREFLTGPTMTLAPIAILAGITKASGKTANIHRANISNLSYLADSKLAKENIDEATFKNNFLNAVVEDMLTQTTQRKAEQEDIDTFVRGIAKYNELSSSKVKADRKQASKLLSSLKETFERIVKSTKEDFSNMDFQSVKYSTYGEKTGQTSFENYVKYMSAYANDYAKANKQTIGNDKEVINLAQDAIKKFEKSWRGKRGFTIAAMIFLTGYIMSFIPKLYTLASGGINPGGKAIYAEAEKREGK
ncbi:MAG: hypothetical protein IKL52_07115 [Candidatus Gastranaerophilales bacterium]|nr:hypothetical protein [Candidatus Gastranaerophilales bacterium]